MDSETGSTDEVNKENINMGPREALLSHRAGKAVHTDRTGSAAKRNLLSQ